MIAYAVIIAPKAKEQMAQLPKEIQQRIYEKLVLAQENPFHYFIRLKGRTDYKLRVGDYRVAADIKQNERRIEVTKAGHRRNFYE